MIFFNFSFYSSVVLDPSSSLSISVSLVLFLAKSSPACFHGPWHFLPLIHDMLLPFSPVTIVQISCEVESMVPESVLCARYCSVHIGSQNNHIQALF